MNNEVITGRSELPLGKFIDDVRDKGCTKASNMKLLSKIVCNERGVSKQYKTNPCK